MSTDKEAFIVGAARTAIGGFGGTLKGEAPATLGAFATSEAVKRSGVDPKTVQSNVVGHVIRTEARDAYISRRVALDGGLPISAQSLTLNRLCGSGLEAAVMATRQLWLGEANVAVAGGTESMSRAGHLVTTSRWGQPMGDCVMQDELTTTLSDPFKGNHMGITAENLAEKYEVSREAQDAFAAESQRRAAHAIEQGYFKEQIAPYTIKNRKGDIVFDTDEHVRGQTTAEGLAGLRPVFKKDGGTVTAGNASGINDGSGMLVFANADEVKNQKLAPMARVVAYGHCGVDPDYMGIGPVGATENALAKSGLKLGDMDVIESNEAFAAQALSVAGQLGLPEDKTNPNGGAIALGHPVGASGAIILIKAIYEMHRIGGQYALATMCIGGGQGIAMIVEKA